MKNFRYILLAMSAAFLTACSSDDGSDSSNNITLNSSSTIELYAVVNQSATLSFTADADWSVAGSAKWLTFSPKSGKAGTNTITLATTETNRTKSSRTVQLTLKSGTVEKKITVRQRGDYAVFTEGKYSLPAEGGVINVRFHTNLSLEQLSVYSTEGLSEWLRMEDESRVTRADYEGYLKPLTVVENTSHDAREGAFILTMDDDQGQLLGLDTLWIHQDGVGSDYVSQDYSDDGQVMTLCEHTTGKGFALVLMGDGFQDKDIADGTYRRVMEKAMDNIFSEEPLSSLKEFFDVYAVVAVSANDQFGDGYSTALSCLPDHQTTGIEADISSINDYVRKVDNLNMERTLAVVIVNSNLHKGVTYLNPNIQGNRPMDYAVALCAIIDNLESETFREVLVHEAVGHGFAKLADEYVKSTNGSATDTDKQEIRWLHGYDWVLNVDVESDSTRVIWSSFIQDTRYAAEGIGVLEGGYTFFKGVYRPTESSMMNLNDSPFNAPSRRAIYNKVIYSCTGREPNYEEFALFDEAHKPTVWRYGSRSVTRSPWSNYLRERKNSCIRWRQLSSSTPHTH